MKVLSRGLFVAALAASIGVGPATAVQNTALPELALPELLVAQATFGAELAAAVAACRGPAASPEACDAAVAAYVAAVGAAGLDADDADDALANLIVALVDGASGLPVAIREIVADAVRAVALAFDDPARADAAEAIADAVEAGTDVETDPLFVSASPA